MTTPTMEKSPPEARPAGAEGPGTAALLFATARTDAGEPVALLPFGATSALGRLAEQLRALGVAELHVAVRPRDAQQVSVAAGMTVHACTDAVADLRLAERLARAGRGPLLIADAAVVAHPAALAALAGGATGILTGATPGLDAVRTARGRVLGAGSPLHGVARPTARFLGVLEVADGDLPALAAGAARLATWLESDPELVTGAGDDVTALLLVALVRAGAPVGARDARRLVYARPRSAAALAEAESAVGTASEERALRDSAVKAGDGFFTTFFVSPYSKHVAAWAARRGLTPNQVTVASMAIAALAAAAFATGHRAGLVAGAVLLQLAFTADCVDGQLARYTRSYSAFGAWLDSTLDRAKEYLVYAGLAIGAGRVGVSVWVLACAALILQTVRHASDLAVTDLAGDLDPDPPQPPLEQAGDGAESPAGAERVLSGWRSTDRVPALVWVRRVLTFPIGERFAAISLTAALWSAHTTFVVLLVGGGVGGAYTLGGRVLRMLSR